MMTTMMKMNSSWDAKAVGGVNGGGLSLGETSSGEGRTGGAAAALIRLRCHVSLCAVSLPFVILQISVLQIWAALHWQPLQFAASPFFFFFFFFFFFLLRLPSQLLPALRHRLRSVPFLCKNQNCFSNDDKVTYKRLREILAKKEFSNFCLWFRF